MDGLLSADLSDLGLTGLRESVTAGGVSIISADLPDGHHDAIWRELRERHSRTGLWPVLSHVAYRAVENTWAWPAAEPASVALERALAVVPAVRVRELVQWSFDAFNGGYGSAERASSWAEHCDPVRLSRRLPSMSGPVVADVRRWTGPSAPRHVLLVPARAGHEVPVLLPGVPGPQNWMGGPEHRELEIDDTVAVLRNWEERYGAELYFASGPTLELSVARPPVEPLDVAVCAIEQLAFCQDLTQVIGDEEDVAREQAPAHHWSFWWD